MHVKYLAQCHLSDDKLNKCQLVLLICNTVSDLAVLTSPLDYTKHYFQIIVNIINCNEEHISSYIPPNQNSLESY